MSSLAIRAGSVPFSPGPYGPPMLHSDAPPDPLLKQRIFFGLLRSILDTDVVKIDPSTILDQLRVIGESAEFYDQIDRDLLKKAVEKLAFAFARIPRTHGDASVRFVCHLFKYINLVAALADEALEQLNSLPVWNQAAAEKLEMSDLCLVVAKAINESTRPQDLEVVMYLLAIAIKNKKAKVSNEVMSLLNDKSRKYHLLSGHLKNIVAFFYDQYVPDVKVAMEKLKEVLALRLHSPYHRSLAAAAAPDAVVPVVAVVAAPAFPASSLSSVPVRTPVITSTLSAMGMKAARKEIADALIVQWRDPLLSRNICEVMARSQGVRQINLIEMQNGAGLLDKTGILKTLKPFFDFYKAHKDSPQKSCYEKVFREALQVSGLTIDKKPPAELVGMLLEIAEEAFMKVLFEEFEKNFIRAQNLKVPRLPQPVLCGETPDSYINGIAELLFLSLLKELKLFTAKSGSDKSAPASEVTIKHAAFLDGNGEVHPIGLVSGKDSLIAVCADDAERTVRKKIISILNSSDSGQIMITLAQGNELLTHAQQSNGSFYFLTAPSSSDIQSKVAKTSVGIKAKKTSVEDGEKERKEKSAFTIARRRDSDGGDTERMLGGSPSARKSGKHGLKAVRSTHKGYRPITEYDEAPAIAAAAAAAATSPAPSWSFSTGRSSSRAISGDLLDILASVSAKRIEKKLRNANFSDEEFDQNLRAILSEIFAKTSGTDVSLRAPHTSFESRLKDYQGADVAWQHAICEASCGGILAAECGLGKTMMKITALLETQMKKMANRPSLVIVPPSLIRQWSDDLNSQIFNREIFVFKSALTRPQPAKTQCIKLVKSMGRLLLKQSKEKQQIEEQIAQLQTKLERAGKLMEPEKLQKLQRHQDVLKKYNSQIILRIAQVEEIMINSAARWSYASVEIVGMWMELAKGSQANEVIKLCSLWMAAIVNSDYTKKATKAVKDAALRVLSGSRCLGMYNELNKVFFNPSLFSEAEYLMACCTLRTAIHANWNDFLKMPSGMASIQSFLSKIVPDLDPPIVEDLGENCFFNECEVVVCTSKTIKKTALLDRLKGSHLSNNIVLTTLEALHGRPAKEKESKQAASSSVATKKVWTQLIFDLSWQEIIIDEIQNVSQTDEAEEKVKKADRSKSKAVWLQAFLKHHQTVHDSSLSGMSGTPKRNSIMDTLSTLKLLNPSLAGTIQQLMDQLERLESSLKRTALKLVRSPIGSKKAIVDFKLKYSRTFLLLKLIQESLLKKLVRIRKVSDAQVQAAWPGMIPKKEAIPIDCTPEAGAPQLPPSILSEVSSNFFELTRTMQDFLVHPFLISDEMRAKGSSKDKMKKIKLHISGSPKEKIEGLSKEKLKEFINQSEFLKKFLFGKPLQDVINNGEHSLISVSRLNQATVIQEILQNKHFQDIAMEAGAAHLHSLVGKVDFYHGGLNEEQKELIMQDYKSKMGPRILILTAKAGNVGLNVQEATTLFNLSKPFHDADFKQGEARMFRVGDRVVKKKVFYYSMGTDYERRMLQYVAQKGLEDEFLFPSHDRIAEDPHQSFLNYLKAICLKLHLGASTEEWEKVLADIASRFPQIIDEVAKIKAQLNERLERIKTVASVPVVALSASAAAPAGAFDSLIDCEEVVEGMGVAAPIAISGAAPGCTSPLPTSGSSSVTPTSRKRTPKAPAAAAAAAASPSAPFHAPRPPPFRKSSRGSPSPAIAASAFTENDDAGCVPIPYSQAGTVYSRTILASRLSAHTAREAVPRVIIPGSAARVLFAHSDVPQPAFHSSSPQDDRRLSIDRSRTESISPATTSSSRSPSPFVPRDNAASASPSLRSFSAAAASPSPRLQGSSASRHGTPSPSMGRAIYTSGHFAPIAPAGLSAVSPISILSTPSPARSSPAILTNSPAIPSPLVARPQPVSVDKRRRVDDTDVTTDGRASKRSRTAPLRRFIAKDRSKWTLFPLNHLYSDSLETAVKIAQHIKTELCTDKAKMDSWYEQFKKLSDENWELLWKAPEQLIKNLQEKADPASILLYEAVTAWLAMQASSVKEIPCNVYIHECDSISNELNFKPVEIRVNDTKLPNLRLLRVIVDGKAHYDLLIK